MHFTDFDCMTYSTPLKSMGQMKKTDLANTIMRALVLRTLVRRFQFVTSVFDSSDAPASAGKTLRAQAQGHH